MNYTTAIFLINSSVRAVKCRYEPPEDNKTAKHYLFKTLDKSIKVDDLVVVPSGTRYGFTVVKVVETDVDVDFDDSVNYKWVVSRVDFDPYNTTIGQEEQAIVVIKSAEKTKQRNALRDALLVDSSEALKALPITIMGDPPALPNAAAEKV